MHVHCRYAQFPFEKIPVSRLIVVMPFAIPVQRNACELGDDPVLGVQTISVLEIGHLFGMGYCDIAIMNDKVSPSRRSGLSRLMRLAFSLI